MFTGLIESLGTVARIDRAAAGFRLSLAASIEREVVAGESVAVNGVCLTVVDARDPGMHFDVSPETARVTTLETLAPGTLVNLERSMRADARVGGHFVQGHVDAVGRIQGIAPEAGAYRVSVSYPAPLAPLLVHKGSVAVDGISLTIAALEADRFDVQIIPFTWQHTNLQAVAIGQPVNLECDILGKYVARALDVRGA
jgi:riboflavin synthase